MKTGKELSNDFIKARDDIFEILCKYKVIIDDSNNEMVRNDVDIGEVRLKLHTYLNMNKRHAIVSYCNHKSGECTSVTHEYIDGMDKENIMDECIKLIKDSIK